MKNITREDIIRHFGGVNNACEAIGISREAFLRWQKEIPIKRLRQIEKLLSKETTNIINNDILDDDLIMLWVEHLKRKFKLVNFTAITALRKQLVALDVTTKNQAGLYIRYAIANNWGKLDHPNGAEKYLHLVNSNGTFKSGEKC